MALVSTDMFTAADLKLFIESIEEITRLEAYRKQCRRRRRARYLIETLRYLDQTFGIGSSCTLSTMDIPVEMQQFEILEGKPIGLYLMQNKYNGRHRSKSFEKKSKLLGVMEEEKHDIYMLTCSTYTASKQTEHKSKEDQSGQRQKQKQKFKLSKYLWDLVLKKWFGDKNDC